MSPLEILKEALKSIQADAFALAEKHNLFLEVDEAGNIWLGEGDGECFRVNGWYLTHNKILSIIKQKELKSFGEIN